MFRESIIEHAERVAEMLDAYPDIAKIEARTKSSLIEPLLRCLGYDPNDPGQVELEAVIRGKKVDYMLTGEKDAKVAVEAKPAKTTLSEKEMDQLDTYFHHSEAVVGVLTNGVDCWLFTDLEKTNVMDSEPYRKINITQLSDNDIHHLETLTRGHVRQSVVREQAQHERYRTLVNEIVIQELHSPSQEFLRLIGRKVGIKPLTKPNLMMLQSLIGEAISRHLVNSETTQQPGIHIQKQGNGPGPPAATKVDPCPLTAGQKAARTLRDFKGATLFGKPLSVSNYTQLLVGVASELLAIHQEDFAQMVKNAPFFKKGRKWQWVSRDQGDIFPDNPTRKVGDFYFDVGVNAKNKEKRARLLLESLGHNPDNLVIHTSGD